VLGTLKGDASHCDPDVALKTKFRATLAEEAELLRELRAVFRRQRQAVVDGRAEQIDDGVFAATRLLRTLGEARAARRLITVGLFGTDLEFSELEDGALVASDPGMDGVRDEVLDAARGLLQEVAVLRGSLEVLLDDNRRCLEVLLGRGGDTGSADGDGALYSSDGVTERPGSLVDRQA